MSTPPTGDTIAAIATATGAAGVGVVRLSGPDVPQLARRLLGREPKPRHAHLAHLRDANADPLDTCLLLYFPAPHSYTGEPVLELQAHGNPQLLQALLHLLGTLGARHARPGEFTERAFLNGKLDLAQAEAVADLVSAGSEAALRAAQRSLAGEFSQRVNALLAELIRLRLHVEAAIDFPEEEIDFLADGAIASSLQALRDSLEMLSIEARRGQRLRDGLHVVLVGPPNSGKSSLLNALAGQERAIVTDVAGTTRDLLRESVRLDGVELTLVDTAGLRVDGDAVEREGMRRACLELERADLALALIGPGQESARAALLEPLQAVPEVLWLHTQVDRDHAHGASAADAGALAISVRDGTGLPQLVHRLRTAAGLGEGSAGAFSARARHVHALERVGPCLERAALRLRERAGELVADDLRQAQQILGEITGEFRSDDLLGRIFSSFCIGK